MKKYTRYLLGFSLALALILGAQYLFHPSVASADVKVVPKPDDAGEPAPYTGYGAAPVTTVQIYFWAITCDQEDKLPNWNFARNAFPTEKRNGPPNTLLDPVVVKSNTATDFVNTHPGCWFQDGIRWHWGPGEGWHLNPPSGPTCPGCTIAGPTGYNGLSVAYINWSTIDKNYWIDDNCYPSLDTNCPGFDGWYNPVERRIYVDAIMPPGYFPFSTYLIPNYNTYDDDPFSAELRCYDNLNAYDDYEFVGSPVPGGVYNCIFFDFLRDQTSVKIVSPDAPTTVFALYASGGNPCRPDGNCRNISGSKTIPFKLNAASTTLYMAAEDHPGYRTDTTFVNGFIAKANNGVLGNLFGLINSAKASDCNDIDTCTMRPNDQATFTVRYIPDTPPPGGSTCNIEVRGYLDGVNQATNANFTLTGPDTIPGPHDAPLKTYNAVQSGSYTLTYSTTTSANGKTYTYDTSSGDPTTLNCPENGTAQFTLRYVTQNPGPCRIDSFTASPASVSAGDYSTLSWSVNNVTSMTVDGVDSNSVGTMQRGPFQTTKTYQLLGNGPDGGTCQASVTVTVVPSDACIIDSFTASPLTVTAGDYSTLSWSVRNVTSMTVDGIDSNSVGNMQRGPFQTNRTYQLLGNGSGGGTCSASVTVTVVPPGASNCIIDSFAASPSTVNQGDYSTLNWSVRNVISMTVDGVDANSVGSLPRGPFQTTTTYQLVGNGPNGGSCSQPVTVTVAKTPPPPPPPPGCTIDYFPNDSAYDGQALVQWQSTGATSLTLAGGQFGSGVSVEPDGSRTIPLSTTTQFTISGPTCTATAWMYSNDVPPPPPPTPDPCEIRVYGYFNNSSAYTAVDYMLTGPATYWGSDQGFEGFGNPITGVVPGTYTISVPSSQTVQGYLSDLTGTDPTTVYCASGDIARFYIKYQSRPQIEIRP